MAIKGKTKSVALAGDRPIAFLGIDDEMLAQLKEGEKVFLDFETLGEGWSPNGVLVFLGSEKASDERLKEELLKPGPVRKL